MKKSLFIVAAVSAMVLTGCSKSETIATEYGQPNVISFENYTHKTTTRAAEVTATTFQTAGNEFKVSAEYKETAESTPAWYFKNVVVDAWANSKYSTSYYWPETGTMNFYAVYPSSITIGDSKTFEYTVADGTVDLVTAIKTGEDCATHSSTATTVELPFSHALAQVWFSAKTASSTYKCTITKIEVICNKTATFTYGSGFGTATTENTYTYISSNTSITSDGQDVGSKATNSLMLIPQSGATVKVYYKSFDSTTDEELADFSGATGETNACKYFTIPLAWTAGNTIKYDLTLPVGANPIEFTATVTAWENPAATEITTFN